MDEQNVPYLNALPLALDFDSSQGHAEAHSLTSMDNHCKSTDALEDPPTLVGIASLYPPAVFEGQASLGEKWCTEGSPVQEASSYGETTGSDGSRMPHQCTECFQGFLTASALEQHARTRSHRCFVCLEPECKKSYCRRDLFTRHKRTHRQLGMYNCATCHQQDQTKAFSRKDHLRQHIRRCHVGISTYCPRSPVATDCSKPWPSHAPGHEQSTSQVCNTRRQQTASGNVPNPKSPDPGLIGMLLDMRFALSKLEERFQHAEYARKQVTPSSCQER